MARPSRRSRAITGLVFTDAHVRRILEGTKTATRRLVCPPPVWHPRLRQWIWNPLGDHGSLQNLCIWDTDQFRDAYALQHCPYGQVGTTLVVREAFQARRQDTLTYWTDLHPHDRAMVPRSLWEVRYRATDPAWADQPRWAFNRFMPYAFARLTIRITSIALQQLHAMTDDDARAEGIIVGNDSRSAVDRYAEIWNALHRTPGTTWEDNPWVWVVTFVRESSKRGIHESTTEGNRSESNEPGNRVV